jgi:hypothetical protein
MVKAPGAARMAMINAQDFAILMEGAGNSRDASVRDVCAGLVASGVMWLVAFWVATDFTRMEGSVRVPLLTPIIAFALLTIFTVGALVEGVLCHYRSRGDCGRVSYKKLIDRIEDDLKASRDQPSVESVETVHDTLAHAD